MLDKLPPEVFDLILALAPRRDQCQLTRVSRSLRQACSAALYQSVEIIAPNEHLLDYLKDTPFVYSSQNHDDPLIYVESATISAPFKAKLQDRCDHDVSPEYLRSMTGQLLPILERLQAGKLQHFTWRLGCCVPNDVVKYLATAQKQLLSISLTTDPECPLSIRTIQEFGNDTDAASTRFPTLVDEIGGWHVDLLGFRSLRDFSWVGFDGSHQADGLSAILQTLSRHLGSLTLDPHRTFELNAEGSVSDAHNNDSVFARKVLRLEPLASHVLFGNLETLELSNMSLWNAEQELIPALNMGQLSSLVSRDCAGTRKLLKALYESLTSLRLTKFELVDRDVLDDIGYYDGADDSEEWIIDFLKSFRGLQHVHLLIRRADLAAWNHWEAIALHRSPIRQLVYHTRYYEMDEESDRYEEDLDANIDWIDEREIMWPLLQAPLLDAVAVCDGPQILADHLSAICPRPQVRILHIRKSISDRRLPGRSFLRPIKYEVEYSPFEMMFPEAQSSQDRELIDNTSEQSLLQSLTDDQDDIQSESEDEEETKALSDSPEVGLSLKDAARLRENGLFSLARWANGPDGLPNLRIIEYGDFAHGRRFAEGNALLCRAQRRAGEEGAPWRLVGRNDCENIDFLESYADFLEACPD